LYTLFHSILIPALSTHVILVAGECTLVTLQKDKKRERNLNTEHQKTEPFLEKYML
jgi:hypothetical protein